MEESYNVVYNLRTALVSDREALVKYWEKHDEGPAADFGLILPQGKVLVGWNFE